MCLMFSNSSAQEAVDTFVLQGYEKKVTHHQDQVGTVKLNLPFNQNQTLNQLLNTSGALYVKQYSPSALATTSMRGMSAQHTALLWNGINLQSCMNGLKDLNLIPLFFIENARLESGANNNLVGQGAVAGAIQLNNKLKAEKLIKLESQHGSFGNYQNAVSFSGFHKRFNFRTKLLHRIGENDFLFKNYFKPNRPLENLGNNQHKQMGLMQELSYDSKSKHSFYLNFWTMQSERNLPSPIGVNSTSSERQNDNNTKVYLQHQYRFNPKLSIQNKLCLIDEHIDYYNLNLSPALSQAINQIFETEIEYQINPTLNFVSSINLTHQNAFADGFRKGKTRDLQTWLNKLDWNSLNLRHKISVSLRSQLHNSALAPLSPEIGYELKLNNYTKLKGNAALCYRLPTFNDLYWQPGGNPDLLPENGRKAEVTFAFAFENTRLNITTFHHQLNNWIIWLPYTGSSFWVAQNAKQVQSNGVEFSGETYKKINHHSHIKLISRYQFVKTINKQTYVEDVKSLGKQLIYTPNHSGMLGLNYHYKNFQMNSNSQYVGQLYTKSDNSETDVLKPYFLINLGLGYQFKFKKHNGELWFNVLNLNNHVYLVMENRPMPLRNYQLTLKININYDKKQIN